jgi:hypothetical protein
VSHRLRSITAALALLVAGMPAAAQLASPTQTSTIQSLREAVAAAAAATRPRHWPLRHACLYYAMAGQTLLARHGIPATLRVGRVVYRPGSPTAHPINPHVWLDTGTHFVDYALLPRCNEVAVVPAGLVATHPAQVVPGVTPVLAITTDHEASMELYLRHHYRRFLGRYSTPWPRQPARPLADQRTREARSGP